MLYTWCEAELLNLMVSAESSSHIPYLCLAHLGRLESRFMSVDVCRMYDVFQMRMTQTVRRRELPYRWFPQWKMASLPASQSVPIPTWSQYVPTAPLSGRLTRLQPRGRVSSAEPDWESRQKHKVGRFSKGIPLQKQKSDKQMNNPFMDSISSNIVGTTWSINMQ